MKHLRKIMISFFTVVITFLITNCSVDSNVCKICGGELTYTMSRGDASNKIIISLSSGEWTEVPITAHLLESLSLTETSTTVGSNSNWQAFFSDGNRVNKNILPDKSKLELRYFSGWGDDLDGSWTGTASFKDDYLVYYTNHELFGHDHTFMGDPITIRVEGTDTAN
ncbi:hypothetical protein [Breznakiella homolactica]|uniref:Uncharacterized protein n=1 Tax=Breznakiella homolactica TaxID=2798577 RepID=A0A7T7XNX2_9SPIR|nr:hypothetical protein [Breznakiella homolactica]QQO09732.1 hypothetical protein JFL75_02095 [Breznakiella homolactica]